MPGLFEAGKAISASVHGASRIGNKPLLDIMVFGWARSNRITKIDTPGNAVADVSADVRTDSVAELDKLRYAKDATD